MVNVAKMANMKMITPGFEEALKDYYFLLNRDYPEKETLKLVADRYRLTGVQRTVLFRGMTSAERALNRKAKQIPLESLERKPLYIDGYNVLFTMMNYLLGKVVFIGNDGLLRDSGETYGNIEKEEIFLKSVEMLVHFLGTHAIEPVTIFLDQPVTGSETHKEKLEREFHARGVQPRILLVPSVDNVLGELTDGVLATSDSEIIELSFCPVLDLAQEILAHSFGISFLDLGGLIKI